MRCIFCRNDRPLGNEHILPASVGGTIVIRTVCTGCNALLNANIDEPFSQSLFVRLNRCRHNLGGRHDRVPHVFAGRWEGADGTRVIVDREFRARVVRSIEIRDAGDGITCTISVRVDPSDLGDLDRVVADPLRAKLAGRFPAWPQTRVDAAVAAVVERVRQNEPVHHDTELRRTYEEDMCDIRFEFMKIAYESWARRFGEQWADESRTAGVMRAAILSRDTTAAIRGTLGCAQIELPGIVPEEHHVIALTPEGFYMSVFGLAAAFNCEEEMPQFRPAVPQLIIQNFITGVVIERDMVPWIAEHTGDDGGAAAP